MMRAAATETSRLFSGASQPVQRHSVPVTGVVTGLVSVTSGSVGAGVPGQDGAEGGACSSAGSKREQAGAEQVDDLGGVGGG